jgi:hypothetical protein
MPIANIVAVGFILLFFGSFMVALAWGAWCTRQTSKLPRTYPTSLARAPFGGRGRQLSPVRVRL